MQYYLIICALNSVHSEILLSSDVWSPGHSFSPYLSLCLSHCILYTHVPGASVQYLPRYVHIIFLAYAHTTYYNNVWYDKRVQWLWYYVYCTPHAGVWACVYTMHIIHNIIQKPTLTNNENSNFSGRGWHDVVVHNVLNKILALWVIVKPVETRNRTIYFEGAYLLLL